MSGLEILGAIASSFELVKVIHSSLSFLNQARNGSQHAVEQRDMHFHLLMQAIRFEWWCEAIDISDIIQLKAENPKYLEKTQQYADFQRRLEVDLRLTNDAVANLTLETLKGLKEKFEQAWSILQGYRPSPLENSTTDLERKSKLKKKWFRFSRGGQSTDHPEDSQGLETQTGSHKKIYAAVRWVGADKKVFSTLLSDITRINDSLLTLLEHGKQNRVQRQAEMAILDNVGSESTHLSELPDDSELKALISIKNLQAEDHERELASTEAVKPYQLHTYHVDDFKGEVVKFGDTRSMCQLEEENVLVEWKYYSKEKPIRLERTLQLGNLVGLLNHMDLFKKFLAPKCKGLVNDDVNSRIGIIFSTFMINVEMQAPLRYQDLQTFIRTSSVIPSLGERFKMAKKLALAMHHLHSVHWLHKSFRSDNVVFFEDTEDKISPRSFHRKGLLSEPDHNPNFQDGMGEMVNPKSLNIAPPPLPRLYIVGWDLSRPDKPSEFSESLSLSSAGFQSKGENMKLYSHPETHLLSVSTKRVRYRAQFDLYSLGLVLLEIGLWRTLDTIRRKCSSDDDFRKRVRTEYCDKLLSKMGGAYWRATRRCLASDFDLSNPEGDTAGDYPLQVAFEEQVVYQLEKCFA
jgi:hypothetical protein